MWLFHSPKNGVMWGPGVPSKSSETGKKHLHLCKNVWTGKKKDFQKLDFYFYLMSGPRYKVLDPQNDRAQVMDVQTGPKSYHMIQN